MNKVRYWFGNARPVALPQSIIPAITALCLAVGTQQFSLIYGFVAVIGAGMAHLAVNLLDDYFDFKNHNAEIREQLARTDVRIRTHKCSYLVEGSSTLMQTFAVASIFASIAVACGLFIFAERGLTIMVLAAAGAFLGFFYSARPFCLCHRGLGELVCFLMFGPLLMTGVYFSTCGMIDCNIILVGFAVGLLVTNILYTHSLLDEIADTYARKRTLASVIRSKKGKLSVSGLFTFMPFVIVSIAVILNYISYWYLMTYIVLPLAMVSFRSTCGFVNESQTDLTPKWWFGRMENWKAIEEHGLDWFMFRWYMARNLATQFSFIISVISIVRAFV